MKRTHKVMMCVDCNKVVFTTKQKVDDNAIISIHNVIDFNLMKEPKATETIICNCGSYHLFAEDVSDEKRLELIKENGKN